MNNVLLDKLIERFFKERELQDILNDKSSFDILPFATPFITIARDPGSGGAPIGRELARRLGYQFYDHELIEEIARKTKMRKEILTEVDEKSRSAIQDLVHGLFNPEYVSDMTFLRHLARVVLTLAVKGNVVILGRGANFFLPQDKGLHVRITAPLPVRVQRAVQYEQLSFAQAKDVVAKHERERRDFVKQYFGKDIRRSEHYDLILNTQFFEVSDSVDLILRAYRAKFPRLRDKVQKMLLKQ